MDIEEIKSRYAELCEDEVLIEKQKNKLVKEIKEIIKTENISSKEDEEKNEGILKLKEKIIEIHDVLTNLEKEKEEFFEQQSTEVKELLKEYIKPAYGAMSKRDFDIILFMKLQELEVIAKTPEIYDVVSSLKVTRAKARNLIYESKLRTSTENDLENELKELVSSPILKDGDKVSLEIGNPYLADYLRSKLRSLNHITDGSFSNELLKMTVDAYIDLFISLLPDGREDIEKALIRSGAKKDTSLKSIVKSIVEKLAKKALGDIGDAVIDNVSDYLKPIIEGQITNITNRFRGFWDTTN